MDPHISPNDWIMPSWVRVHILKILDEFSQMRVSISRGWCSEDTRQLLLIKSADPKRRRFMRMPTSRGWCLEDTRKLLSIESTDSKSRGLKNSRITSSQECRVQESWKREREMGAYGYVTYTQALTSLFCYLFFLQFSSRQNHLMYILIYRGGEIDILYP